MATGDELASLLHSNSITMAAYSLNGDRFATGDSNGNVRVWDSATYQRLSLCNPPGPNNALTGIGFLENGQYVLSTAGGILFIYQAADGVLVSQTDGDYSQIAISPNQKAFCSSVRGGDYVRFGTLANVNALLLKMPASSVTYGQVKKMEYSPDGAVVALLHSNQINVIGNALVPRLTAMSASAPITTGTSQVEITASLSTASLNNTFLYLTSSSSALTVPNRVPISVGDTAVKFTVRANSVSPSSVASITGTMAGCSMDIPIVVRANSLRTLSVSVPTTVGGTTIEGRITLSSPAPDGGTIVYLGRTSSNITVPSSIVVPKGQSQVSFPIETSAVHSNKTVNLKAARGSVKLEVTIALTP